MNSVAGDDAARSSSAELTMPLAEKLSRQRIFFHGMTADGDSSMVMTEGKIAIQRLVMQPMLILRYMRKWSSPDQNVMLNSRYVCNDYETG